MWLNLTQHMEALCGKNHLRWPAAACCWNWQLRRWARVCPIRSWRWDNWLLHTSERYFAHGRTRATNYLWTLLQCNISASRLQQNVLRFLGLCCRNMVGWLPYTALAQAILSRYQHKPNIHVLLRSPTQNTSPEIGRKGSLHLFVFCPFHATFLSTNCMYTALLGRQHRAVAWIPLAP